MTDAHTHIDQYGTHLSKALDQIRKLSIRSLAVSMDIPSFRETQRIAESEPLIIPSFGIHPWNASEYVNRLEELTEPLEEAEAIGEIGLCHRFVEDETEYPAQLTVFNYFLDEAERTGKLINLHTSGAEAEILESLKGRNLPAMIVHWYSGPLKYVQEYLKLGAYFTIGVEVLQSETIRSLAAQLPEDRILTETDNPSGWDWLHGEAGFPELIESVESKVAKIRGKSQETLSTTMTSNFVSVLRAGGINI